MNYKNIFLILLIVIYSIPSVSALSFSNFTSNGTGSINTGNGYFDDDSSQFNFTGSRNVYSVTEDAQIHLVEPIGYAGGSSGAIQVINSSLGTLKDSVVHNGYLYFVDGTTLKKKKTRSNTGTCESNDTSAGGCITTISTGVGESLRVHNNVLYFTTGTTGFKHLDSDDNVVDDFAICAPFAGDAQRTGGYTVTTNNSAIQVYAVCGGTPVTIKTITSTTTTTISTGELGNAALTFYTSYTTQNYVYILVVKTGGGISMERLYRISNSSASSVDYVTSNILEQNNRVYVGGQSTIGLMVTSSTVYETFNSNEAGTDSLPVVPSEITYLSKTISSLQSQYYNRSNIFIQYNVSFSTLDTNNLLIDPDDYRWMVVMTDPNGISKDVTLSSRCQFPSITSFTCSVGETLEFAWPPPGWLIGVWSAKLYEVNIVTQDRALIATSSSFTVLNTTVENQSVINPPIIPPTSGTAPQAIALIDGFVLWLGMGINSVSKLLFAMIFIAIAATVGLIWGNGNIAMVFAFVPFAFFTFIEYIPKWIFVIAIILIAIASRAFR